MNRRHVFEAVAIFLLILVFLGGFLATTAETGGDAHPRSAAPSGTRAISRALARLGLPLDFWARHPRDLEGKDNLLFLTRTHELKMNAIQGKWNDAAPLPADELLILGRWVRLGNTLVVPAQFRDGEAHPSSDDFLQKACGLEWVNPGAAGDPPAPWMRFLEGDARSFAVEAPLGAGSVILYNSTDPLENRGVRDSDGLAAEFLSNLIKRVHGAPNAGGAPVRDGRLLLDTYFHGERDYGSAFSLIFSGAVFPVTLQLMAAAILGIWAAAVRFGAIEAPSRLVESGAVAAARGIGDLFRRSGNPGLAARAISLTFAERARAAFGMPPSPGIEPLAVRISESLDVPLSEAREALSPGAKISPREFILYSQKLHLLEQRIQTRINNNKKA